MCDFKDAILSLCLWAINVITLFIPPVKAGVAGVLKFILTPLWLVKQANFMQNFPEKKVLWFRKYSMFCCKLE